MRILVLRGGALGDFVVTLPALGLLRQRWPDAHIALVGNPRAAELGRTRHYLDAVHDQNEACWIRPGENAGLREFDLVINYWPDFDGAIEKEFAQLGFRPEDDASRRFVTHPSAPTQGPAAAHYCAGLAALGLAATSFAAPLHLLPEDHRAADELLSRSGEKLIAWHPGSGSRAKNWPIERWFDALRPLVTETEHTPLVLLGEADAACARALSAAPAFLKSSIVLREVPTPILAAVLARCQLFLGHDSGPSHVAAAAGCPCVLLFGPTDPQVWAPPYPDVAVVHRGDSMLDITVPEVIAAARAKLARERSGQIYRVQTRA